MATILDGAALDVECTASETDLVPTFMELTVGEQT